MARKSLTMHRPVCRVSHVGVSWRIKHIPPPGIQPFVVSAVSATSAPSWVFRRNGPSAPYVAEAKFGLP
eukprot:1921310-Pyramimonas_sp.AAC.1